MAKMSMYQALPTALVEEMVSDEKVIMIGEDIGPLGSCWMYLRGMYAKFGPQRMLEMPIAEAGYTLFSTGLALAGYRPVVEMMFADFSAIAYEGIVDIAAKLRYFSGGKQICPTTFLMPQGGGGMNGGAHAQSVEGWFANIPGLKIVAPTDPADVRAYLRASIRENDPVIFCYARGLFAQVGEVPETINVPSLTNAGKIVKEGKDLTIVAYHSALIQAIAAVAEVEAETGKSIEIIDPRVLVPFDRELLEKSLKKTGRLLVSHEAPERGGFSAQIVSWAMETNALDMKSNPVRVCGKNSVIPFGPAEKFIYPNKDDIKAGILKALG